MATTPSNIQTCYHARSNSFPSRSHPLTSEVDEHLTRLASSESASTSSSLNHKLSSLQDLHDCIDKLLQLPLTQQILAQEKQREYVDELLNGSVRLLDFVCHCQGRSIAIKGKHTRTSINLAPKASLEGPAKFGDKENKRSTVDNDTGAMVSLLMEVQAVTLSVLESLLSFSLGSDKESKMSRWSKVSKLFHTKRVGSEGEQQTNEMANAEANLLSLATSKSDIMQIKNVQDELQKSESCIQDFEEGLEGIFRRLIKGRVNILNILNH
ncbi:hypothetical protein DITRI_Ditri08aG0146300 [Diplodiscus trichospermus]